ncbi:MAG: hypothetical protein KAW12_02565, partial [Candidatus Aminicenantes bacterium]|nr:hypothetical protein [Candidatus Aminicenantes bacterium]
LLMSKYLVGVGDIKRAAALLKGLKFEEYNKEYIRTYAYVLLELRERRVEKLLYEFFARDKWDKDINRLMGRYYLWVKGRGNVQNWINRAIMCGDDIKRLQEIFTGQYKFPGYEYIPFFAVRRIKWISDTVVLVVATKKSGAAERIFMIDAETKKIMRTFDFRGECQDIFLPPHLEDTKYINMILATTAKANESVNLYAVKVAGKNVLVKPVLRGPQPMPSVHVGFNKAGNLAYITDGTLASVAFESPFSQVSAIVGRKTPVYPRYPFPVYRYNFNRDVVDKVTDPEQLRRSPIKELQKYFLLCDAYIDNDQVKGLIRRGQQLELTSDEVVRTYIAKDNASFIIYLSDLNNAFQAIIYDNLSNKIKKVDETMFLGKNQYAEIKILDFRPKEKDLYMLTKDKEQRLVSFNYNSFLYSRLGRKVWDFFRDEKQDSLYVLTERSKKPHFIETNLEIIGLDPYWRNKMYSRKDLKRILYSGKDGYVYFSTYTGEVVKMDREYNFHYVGPSLEGLQVVTAPGGKRRAAFIKDRVVFLELEH